jgi:hypothetical protein
LHEIGDGLFAYQQPDGGWRWSNAGPIAAEGTSLLVDTLDDLRLTREMLEAMAPVIGRERPGSAVAGLRRPAPDLEQVGDHHVAAERELVGVGELLHARDLLVALAEHLAELEDPKSTTRAR